MPPQQLRLEGTLHNQKSILEIQRKYHPGPLSCSYLQHIHTITLLVSILTPSVTFISKNNKRTESFRRFWVPRFPLLEERNVRTLAHQPGERHKISARQDHFRSKFKSQDYPADVAS